MMKAPGPDWVLPWAVRPAGGIAHHREKSRTLSKMLTKAFAVFSRGYEP